MKKSLRILTAISIIAWASLDASAQHAPDLILVNGKIFTADETQRYVQALAIEGNRIVATGKTADIEALATSKTRKIDLKGKTVVPGFNDAHDHLGYAGPSHLFYTADFSAPGPDKKTILDSLARILKRARKSDVIGGPIGVTALFDQTMRQSLDSLAPANPVILNIMWGHGVVINTAAMKLLNLSEEEPDIPGGWYARIPGSNRITGALYESTQWPVWHKQSTSDPEATIKGLHDFGRQQIEHGITTVQDMSCSFPPDRVMEFMTKANFAQRVRVIPMPGATKGIDFNAWTKVSKHPAPNIYVSGVKYIIDGTPLEQTALGRTPYPGRPGWYGRLNYSAERMRSMLKDAYEGRDQLMLHIVGDSAMSVVLQMMKATGKDEVWRTRRVRFEHNASGHATTEDRRMIREMGVIMAHTPKYGHQSYLKSLIDSGIIVSVSPDGTVNPFWDIMTMTSGQVDPRENISREQAVVAFTKTNAYAEFTEKDKGTLITGMLADLAVLSADLFSVPADRLPGIKSVMTMVDGKIVYEAPME
jgi:predicted amidohydrolase YtcJ